MTRIMARFPPWVYKVRNPTVNKGTMLKRTAVVMATRACSDRAATAYARGHAGHMTTAAIAVAEIRRAAPTLSVAEGPKVAVDYWKNLQPTAHRRMTLAGYRIAGLVISAADKITAERKFVER